MHQQQHAFFAPQAQGQQGSRRALDALGQLAVGEGAQVVNERELGGPLGVDGQQVLSKVEAGGGGGHAGQGGVVGRGGGHGCLHFYDEKCLWRMSVLGSAIALNGTQYGSAGLDGAAAVVKVQRFQAAQLFTTPCPAWTAVQ